MSRQEQRHSTLPDVVIPLLLMGPQTHMDRSGRVRSATSPDARGGETVELNPLRPLQPSVTLPSISSITETRDRDVPYRQTESPEPQDFPGQGTRDYGAGPSILYGSAMRPSSIPHGQTQRYPIRSDPSFYASSLSTRHISTYTYSAPPSGTQFPRLRQSSWAEGEAGPSSLHAQRGSYTPAQVEWDQQTFRAEGRERRPEEGREGERGSNPGESGSSYGHEFSGAQHFTHPVHMRNEGGPSHSVFEPLRVGVQTRQSYPFPTFQEHISFPEASTDRRRSETDVTSYAPRLEKGEEKKMSPVQSGKKRRELHDVDDGKRKTKVPRKICIACDFCRGRKLRCDGEKPCRNCFSREKLCEYRSHLKRRGPGKAPKGTRAKKQTVGHLPTVETFNPQIDIPPRQFDPHIERRRQGTIDTLPPYTVGGEDTPPPYADLEEEGK